ncbi:conserved Plasmodium protein, unknown function [Plasmodium knowlesi strain H]|uniref:Thioredoxin-like protein n=3 Tax=Plasmodium knowlesi TaxID=5850 RepID=A0A5K1VJZ0_PLAKH|nr:conserved Plasmodium protein, unknown function [Plasmodium knowlesi strain H]OTN67414.1 Uncharacterized protein PKNOH_S06404200 [Plasmodium knowlesi]CAA9987317.1 conserved Plasmodium protein, unknown function [Plasmodium knowlesi strain H]SBO23404.1 conserved Plasmodium protein, unknown function [Plasmodium knowlesi strain H]SBO24654.1 conserved Plasmodium protein, unknown function [Plasmodium knowlesi strain H]VVS76791.1 conserved Plasmodium protein, unknown function [Plasmodium knowlesi s|eukprot:XP_002258321.1 hypothetical protein, conserved in Plasmodium species [Plasmodium knowlesi strain H]
MNMMMKVVRLYKVEEFLRRSGKISGTLLSRSYSTAKINNVTAVDNKYIYNVYKLDNTYYNNLKVINSYDEYHDLVVKNEYFKDYSKLQDKFNDGEMWNNSIEHLEDGFKPSIEERKDAVRNNFEKMNEENECTNVITSTDLQVLYFGSYENNISVLLFEKFKSIIEKNKKLQFFFLDVNVCPQCSYNCDVTYVPCVCLIYKNHLFRKKLEINYENPIDEKYLDEYLSTVQKSIDSFHKYNNKFIYKLKKQSNYLNTKYIDVDNQNIHKENWNTF